MVRLILDGTMVRVRLDRKATTISLLVVLGVRRDGQKGFRQLSRHQTWWITVVDFRWASYCLEDPKNGNSPAECAQSAAIGGNMLAMEGLDTQETLKLIEGTTKSSRRGDVLEASHGSVSILDPAMVLLKSIVQVHVGPMADRLKKPSRHEC